jgi:P-loop containing NTP hydrolase pore-1
MTFRGQPTAFCHAEGISALQYQSICLACKAHEKWNPDQTRTGFFLGDGGFASRCTCC